MKMNTTICKIALSNKMAARTWLYVSNRAMAIKNINNNNSSELRRYYHVNIVEHYENPRNVGSLDANDSQVGTGLVGAPACGDVMKLQIRISPEDGTIIESKFKTFGCGSAIASSSVATEWVKGKTVDEVLKIQNTDIAAHLKLPPVKLHCSMLAEDAIKAAVADWKQKQAQSKVATEQTQ
jgi:iron-sulfur cluster assembly enzyme ISCU, mitochondrial